MHWGPGRSLVAFVKTLRTLGSGCCSSDGGGDGMFNTLRNGVGPPPSELGNDGDFYIDTDADTIYGPRGGIGGVSPGDWGPPTSMIGPPGADGEPGSAVLENIGDGEDIYAGAVGGVSRIRGIKGTGAAVATTAGSNIEIDVDVVNVGGEEEIYAGLDVDEKIQLRTIKGAGVAQVTTDGNTIEVMVPAAEAGAQEGVNLGSGEEAYVDVDVDGNLEFRTFTGSGVAVLSTVGNTVNVHVPAAAAGAQEGVNVGAGQQIYKGLSGGGDLEMRTVTASGAAVATTAGDTVNIHVPEADAGITIDGPVGGMTLKVSDTELEAVIGAEGQIPRVASATITFEDPVEVPEGDVNDVVGLDGLGGLKNLGPMPSEGGGGDPSFTLGGATGQILYKNGTNSIGGTSWMYAAQAFLSGAAGYVAAGVSNFAAKAWLRLSNSYGAIIAQRDQTNTLDEVLLASAADKAYLFSNTGLNDQVPNGYIYAALTLLLGIGRNTFLRFISTYIEQWVPIIGGGGKPYGMNGEYTFATGTQPASITALSKYIWHFPPGSVETAEYNITVTLPTNFVEGYTKFINLASFATLRITTGVAYVDLTGPKKGVVAIGVSSVTFGGA